MNEDQREIVRAVNAYYGEIADAVLETGGDVNSFEGAFIFSLYGALQPVDDKQILVSATVAALDRARASVERSVGRQVGLGMCCGKAVYGVFGSDKLRAATGFGPPVNCARQLAQSGSGINLCEHLMVGLSLPDITMRGLTQVCVHRGSG